MSELAELQQRFEIQRELGRGGMGAVFRVRERHTGRELALKIVLAATDSQRQRERFRREGELTARLNHPGIVRVHGSGEASGRPWLAYELIEGGGTLADALRTAAPHEQARMLRDAARALGAAHAQGIVHRDVKPSNLLIDAEGRVRVADFGLATAQDLERLTQTGALVGTPNYMAPELLSGQRERIGPAADVWALGVMLYEGLTGRLPFEAGNLYELAAAIERGRFARPSSIDATLPRALEDICLKALQSARELRYADGDAMADDLDRFLAGRPVLASGRGRRRWVLATAAASLAVVAGAGAVALNPPREVARVGGEASPVAAGEDETARLKRRATAGEVAAALELARRLRAAGDLAGARRWLRPAAEAGGGEAIVVLAELAQEAGRAEEAARWWKALGQVEEPALRLRGLLALADQQLAVDEPVKALELLQPACGLGWDGLLAARLRVRRLLQGAKPLTVRRWAHDVPRTDTFKANLGRLCWLVAGELGRGSTVNWALGPERLAAQRAWLSLGFRVGDACCSLELIRRAVERGRAFPEEIGALIVDQANRNDPGGQWALAVLLQEGRGHPRDDRQALELLRKAAPRFPPALARLGEAHRDGRAVRADAEEAARCFREAWGRGVRLGLVRLIGLLGAGRAAQTHPQELRVLVEQACVLGVGWAPDLLLQPGPPLSAEMAGLIRTAERGSPLATSAATNMLLDGQGAPRHVLRALRLLRRDAHAGRRDAMARLGAACTLLLHDPWSGHHWTQRAAAAGHVRAKVRIATLHIDAPHALRSLGERVDPARARRLLVQAYENGDNQAAVRLGQLHADGREGFPKNLAVARKFLGGAARAGSRDAKAAFAEFLFRHGAPADRPLAQANLDAAVRLGSPDGFLLQAQRLWAEAKGARQRRRALDLVSRAARLGHGRSELQLGKWLIERGSDLQRREGLNWIRRAAGGGDPDAAQWLFSWQERNQPN